MVKVVIVDDKLKTQENVKEVIIPVLKKYEDEIDIQCYCGYNSQLAQEIQKQDDKKIYILDINLESQITGLNIALKIRDYDWNSEIIFLTNHDHYLDKVYRNVFKICKFIEKFDNMNYRLTNCIEMIMKKKFDIKKFHFKNNRIEINIYLKDILYIYRDKEDRKIFIETDNNTYILNKNLKDMFELLDDDRFKQVHRSCIANINRVKNYDWDNGNFTLDNGKTVDLLSSGFKEELTC